MPFLDGSVTISAFSTDARANYQQISNYGQGPGRLDTQLARVFVTIAASGAPAGGPKKIRFKLFHSPSSTCVGMIEASVDVSAAATVARTNSAGSGGDFVGTCVFPNGTDLFDLTGPTSSDEYQWWVGSPDAALTNATAYTLNFSKTTVT